MKISRDHLTTIDDELELKAAYTHPGQAHFAEPTGAYACGQCAHFEPQPRNDQRGRCHKAANLAMKSFFSMPAFPATARACKFFAAVEEPD
jgi:hypothetical protein